MPSFFAAVATIAQAVEDDPRVASALTFLEGAGMGRTARLVRELAQNAPKAAEGVADAALEGLRAEASELDDYLSRRLSRAVDEALVRGKARAQDEALASGESKPRAAGGAQGPREALEGIRDRAAAGVERISAEARGAGGRVEMRRGQADRAVEDIGSTADDRMRRREPIDF